MWPPEKENSLIKGWDRVSIAIDFDNLGYYCSYLNETLEDNQLRFKEKELKEAEKLDEKEKSYFYDYMSDDRWRLHNVFPSLHWNSTFITAYGLFEYHLNAICMILQNRSKCGIKMSIIRGKGIERSKIYLSSIWNLRKFFSGKDWSKIKDYALVRNSLTHNSGELKLDKDGPKNHKKISKLLKTHDAVEIDVDYGIGRIKLKPSLVIESIKMHKKFLMNLCNIEKPN